MESVQKPSDSEGHIKTNTKKNCVRERVSVQARDTEVRKDKHVCGISFLSFIFFHWIGTIRKKKGGGANYMASVRKRTIPTERPPFVSEVSANLFADRGCHVVSVTNPYGRIFGFLDRSHYYFFQVAPQLYS
jgi:hypothetical protein